MNLLKIISLAVLLLCSLHVIAIASDEEINRCELCNRTELKQIILQNPPERSQNENETLKRCCIALADILEQDDPERSDLRGDPYYILVTHTTNPNVEKDHNFKIYLYIDGAGNVSYNEIIVSIPHYIVKNNTVNLIYRRFENFSTSPPIFCSSYNISQQGSRFNIYPEKYAYWRLKKNRILIGASDHPGKDTNPLSIIDFTIDSNAPSGDHDIVLAYIYTYLNKSYVQKETVRVHVNYWYETGFYQYLLTSVAILTIFSSIYYLHSSAKWKQFLMLILFTIMILIFISLL